MDAISITRSATFPSAVLCRKYCRHHAYWTSTNQAVPGLTREQGGILPERPDRGRNNARQAPLRREFNEARDD